MFLSLKLNKLQILLFFLILTIIIFTINTKTIIFGNSLNLSFNLRNLILTEKQDERCLKTHKDFLKKYNDISSTDLKIENISLNQYHKALIDIIGYKKYQKIKDYLLRIIIFIIIGIMDIILIIIWIVLWSYCCCIKRDKSSTSCTSKCFIPFFWFLNVIAILFCVFGFFIIPNFYKSINGVICSLYKFIFHFIEGTQNDFQPSNWKGVEGLNFLINSYIQNNNSLQNFTSINEENLNEKERQLLKLYKNYTYNIDYENDNIFMNDLLEAKKNIEIISKPFSEIKKNKIPNLENKMEYFDKYCKLGLYIMFSVFLCFSFFELLSLTTYYICNINCGKNLFHLFWNIEFLFIIVTILIGGAFGIIGVVSKDISYILKYAKTNENLKSNKTLIFDFNKYYKGYIDICFNGDGDLSELAFSSNIYFGESNKDDFENLENFDKDYSTNKENKENEKLSNELEILYKTMKNLKELYDDLKDDNLKGIFDCTFMKYDFNILITELENSIAKELILFSLIIIVINFIKIMAIFFGIIVAKNYGRKNQLESKGNLVKIKQKDNMKIMDSSSDNLRNKIIN